MPGTGVSRSIEESPSPATAGSPYSVNDCPFQTRKSGPGTSGGVLPGGPHLCERATETQASGPDAVGVREVTEPASAGTVTRFHACPSRRTCRGGTGRSTAPPTNPAVPPAHTSVGDTAGTLPTAARGKPSTIVCRRA
ncbi:hypothetical protein [Streptomyces massasporeus]|uniref:hypothetical protein n=1 Tax=Streptomyces massasporeus TaxID=67324 RepID=UPI00369FB5C8